MNVRLITAAQTLPLRQVILRPGRPAIESVFEGDDVEGNFHVGAFSDTSEDLVVGIATMLKVDDPRCEASPAYRLRGMAVATDQQRTGIGSATLQFAEEEAARRDANVIWCNAREEAVPFYLRHGYETVGDIFTLPNIGPHFFCRKQLG